MRIRFCCSVITNENRRLLLTLNVLYLLNLQVTCFHIGVNKIFKQIIWCFRRHYVVNMSKYSLTGPLNNKRTHLFLLVSICFFTLLDYTKVRFWLYLTNISSWLDIWNGIFNSIFSWIIILAYILQKNILPFSLIFVFIKQNEVSISIRIVHPFQNQALIFKECLERQNILH